VLDPGLALKIVSFASNAIFDHVLAARKKNYSMNGGHGVSFKIIKIASKMSNGTSEYKFIVAY